MTKYLWAIIFLIAGMTQELAGQSGNKAGYYWVEFTHKDSTAFSVDEPGVFLSPKAIARRTKFQIPISPQDFPPAPAFLDSLKKKGAQIKYTSRWLNAATILIDKKQEKDILDLGFVARIEYVGKPAKVRWSRPTTFRHEQETETIAGQPYGYAAPQVSQLRGDSLHRLGYRGEGIMIAVLDGGFKKVDSIPFFDSLRAHNRLLFHYDFVDKDSMVYEASSHGSQVLSIMAANVPGLLVGTAPDATYICIRTEDTRGEHRIEECNWVAGIEYADSIGADIVNSSLGYTTFSDKKMDYTFEDLDGNTSMASKAAAIASTKGMIVVSSAGNSGNSEWKHLGVPSDGKNVLSVGSNRLNGKRASFSSVGPTADGRTKPDISALGYMVAVTSTRAFKVNIASGTSVSSPLIAGMVACLWQAHPGRSNLEIIKAVKDSGHQAENPDNELGHGIPDFLKAHRMLSEVKP